MELGNKIQELRKKNNLSQEALADKVGVARQTISKWELNETSPDLKDSTKLCEIFNITLDELTGGKTTNNNIGRTVNFTNYIGMFFVDLFAICLFIIFILFIITMILFGVSMFVLSICLIFKINIGNVIPYIPYSCSLIISMFMLIVCFLSILSSYWLIYFYKICFNKYKYFRNYVLNRKNIICEIKFKNKDKMKNIILVLSILALVLLILSIIACMINSKSIEFWHTWNWFLN